MNSEVLAYALIGLALFLLAGELCLPTLGVLGVLGIASLVTGLAMTFSQSASRGLATVIIIFILIPILAPILVHYYPKTALGRRFVLSQPDDDATVANMPVNLELEQLRGRYGRAVSALRPAGIVEFDGRRVDTLGEGDMIEPGQWVRCIDVKAGKVIVRQVDRPPDLENMDTSDLVS